MKGNVVEAIIGAIVLGVAAFFLVFVYRHVDTGASGGYELTAKFDNVGGLKNGSDVRMSGIKIGVVTGTALVRDDRGVYQAAITFTVKNDVQLPEDSTAQIASEGLLGGNFLDLKPGGAPDMLAGGDQVEYTQGAVDLMGLISKAMFSSDAKGKTPATGDAPAAEQP